MSPQKFTQANAIAEYGEARMDIRTASGYVLSCWRPSWRERLSVILFGRVWLSVNSTEPPRVLLVAQRRII
jgi:hypothetical protein